MAESTAKSATRRGRVEGTAGLAAHLGVSRWTVSRVLNGHEGVRAETRNRILQAVETLGFEPNKLARGLRGVPSGLVGVSFPHLEAMVLAQKSQALRNELGKSGYRGLFEMPQGNPEVEAEVVRHFLSVQVDGIVLIGSSMDADSPVFDEVRERNVAIVAVDPRNALRIPRVSLDRHRAMYLKLAHLAELGHRKIGILGFESDDLYRSIRIRGLRRAGRKLGLPETSFLWFDERGFGHQEYAYGASLARRVLEMGEAGPTALFCLNDRLAIGAMRTIQFAGKRIPEDYSVVGFDNLPETEWSVPALTTIDQNIGELMRTANELLWDAASQPACRKVEPRLLIRGSTGIPGTQTNS